MLGGSGYSIHGPVNCYFFSWPNYAPRVYATRFKIWKYNLQMLWFNVRWSHWHKAINLRIIWTQTWWPKHPTALDTWTIMEDKWDTCIGDIGGSLNVSTWSHGCILSAILRVEVFGHNHVRLHGPRLSNTIARCSLINWHQNLQILNCVLHLDWSLATLNITSCISGEWSKWFI